MSTLLYLIRHGATSANEERPYRLQGSGSDLVLSELGQAQAEATAKALAGLRLAAVYTSPLSRAVQTASPIARVQGVKPIPVEEITEAHLGRWEGLTWEQASLADPVEYERFHKNPGTAPYAGGESFLDVETRAKPALERLALEHEGGAIAVVAHNILNRAVLAGFLGLPIDLARTLRQANGGVNLIEYGQGKPIVVMINSCLHLNALTDSN
jgi:broad specificity phosphatase PhoE